MCWNFGQWCCNFGQCWGDSTPPPENNHDGNAPPPEKPSPGLSQPEESDTRGVPLPRKDHFQHQPAPPGPMTHGGGGAQLGHHQSPPGQPPHSYSGTQSGHHQSPPGPHSSSGAQSNHHPGQQHQNVHTEGHSHAPHPHPAGTPHMPPHGPQHYGPTVAGPHGTQHQPFFQYSQCTGRKKALCIGINYFGDKSELHGCINDVHNIQQFLCKQFGYKPEDIVTLTDDSKNPAQIPTKANMIRAMQQLVHGAKPHDHLFFHYSGHGGRRKYPDGGFSNESIFPADFKTVGTIVDNDLFLTLVKPLPPGCRLTTLFDSCHSGAILDLPYMYATEGRIKEPNLEREADEGLLSTGLYLKSDEKETTKGPTAAKKGSATETTRHTKTSPADVICWSGCKDDQTSADALEDGKRSGAMSYAFVKCHTKNPHQTYLQLLASIREEIREEFRDGKLKKIQIPQLSSSHPMDMHVIFIC